MSDVRTLLHEVTDRPPATGDPVYAVHAAAVRHAAVRVTASAAVVAWLVAVVAIVTSGATGPATVRPGEGTPSATTSEQPLSRPWHVGASNVTLLVEEHPEVFLGSYYESQGAFETIVVTFTGDADRAAWRDDLAAAAEGMRISERECPGSRAHYDRIAGEVSRFAWPSGTAIRTAPEMDEQFCKVLVTLRYPRLDPRDAAAAAAKWGDEVSIMNSH